MDKCTRCGRPCDRLYHMEMSFKMPQIHGDIKADLCEDCVSPVEPLLDLVNENISAYLKGANNERICADHKR